MNPEEIAAAAAGFASDRKAQDIVELDLRGIIGYTDYFVICTGRSDRQTKGIHEAIHQGMKSEFGLLPRRVEGVSEGRWILLDYLDVVVHVFTPETREYYRLEQLWGEAPVRVADAATRLDDRAFPLHPADRGRAVPARLRRWRVRDPGGCRRRIHPHPRPVAPVPELDPGPDHRDQPGRGVLQRRLGLDRLRPPAADRLPLGGRVRTLHPARVGGRRAAGQHRFAADLRRDDGSRTHCALRLGCCADRGTAHERQEGTGVPTAASPIATGNTYRYRANVKVGAVLSVGVGFISSFLGIGGGVVHVPMLVGILGFPTHIATATSHFVLAFMALAATITHVARRHLSPRRGAAPRRRPLGWSGLGGAARGAPVAADQRPADPAAAGRGTARPRACGSC